MQRAGYARGGGAYQPKTDLTHHRNNPNPLPAVPSPANLSLSPFQGEIERGSRVRARGGEGPHTNQPTHHQKLNDQRAIAPFVGRKGRERSERGMPGAAGPTSQKPTSPTIAPIRYPQSPLPRTFLSPHFRGRLRGGPG